MLEKYVYLYTENVHIIKQNDYNYDKMLSSNVLKNSSSVESSSDNDPTAPFGAV